MLLTTGIAVLCIAMSVHAGRLTNVDNVQKFPSEKIRATPSGVYYVSTEEADWFEAFRLCNQRGFVLAVPSTLQKNNDIKNVIKKTDGVVHGRLYWFGGTDLGSVYDGDFYWLSTGKNVGPFTDFYRGPRPNPQPDNAGRVKHCLQYQADFQLQWNDFDCFKKARFVCELEPLTAPPVEKISVEAA